MRSSTTAPMNALDNPQPQFTLNKPETTSSLKRPSRKHTMTKDRALSLSDLSSGQDALFLNPNDYTSYLEGTILGSAHTPRSYFIGAQGCRYRCNRQHICSINTDTPSPFTRPCTHNTKTRQQFIHFRTISHFRTIHTHHNI